MGRPRRGRGRRRRRRRGGGRDGTSLRLCWSRTTRAGSAETTVEALPPGRVVLERSDDSRRPGVYGIEWLGGRAIAGAILSEDEDTVTRRLRAVDGYLAPGMEVAIDPNVYAGDPSEALGLPSSTVADPRRARADAGLARPRSHPYLGDRRPRHQRHSADRPADGARPPSRWPADAADHLPRGPRRPAQPGRLPSHGPDRVARPRSRGALRVRARRPPPGPAGYSMGGAIVSQFMQRSPLAPRVAGLVLDAPALDWQGILSFNATEMGFPSFAALPVEWAIGARIDADWESLDALRHPDDFQLPILLFHGADDDCRADLDQRRVRRTAAALGHLLPRARGGPHRGVERRPRALRTPARAPS